MSLGHLSSDRQVSSLNASLFHPNQSYFPSYMLSTPCTPSKTLHRNYISVYFRPPLYGLVWLRKDTGCKTGIRNCWCHKDQRGSEAHKVLYHMATWDYIPAGKEAGAWNWPVTPPRAEVKEWLELYYHNHIWFHDVRLRGKLTLTVTVRIRIVCQATDNILSFRIM